MPILASIGGVALWCLGTLSVRAALPEYTPKLGDHLWTQAEEQVEKLGKGTYEGNTNFVCDAGSWGDGPQCNQWDQGRSPCWPSAMTVSAAWDLELMELWTRELAQEFGGPGRGQLGPGVNLARFPWNGRLGEYMAGEDPYFGSHMVSTMVRAARKVKNPPLQVVKHFIPNTIEKARNSIVEEVDERTLFEVYYPPFEAAVEAGVAAFMCSYNLVKCTTGRCNNEGVYACASGDVLNEHLKGVMGFKGMVISDWDATKCQDAAADSPGCTQGGYIDNDFAAEGGLDLEMPSCMTFSGGVTKRAKEKAMRMQWSYLVQEQASPAIPARRLAATASHPGKVLKWKANDGKCFQVSWDGDDSTDAGLKIFMSDCTGGDRQLFYWATEEKRLHWASHPTLCLGVADKKLEDEAPLRVMKCSDADKGQEFVIPKNKGQMVSTADTGLCVKASWSGAMLATCDNEDVDQEVEWGGHVRSAAESVQKNVHHTNLKGAFIMTEDRLCLQAGPDGGFPYNGLKLVFEKCDETETSQRWSWYRGNSTIKVASHPSICVDVPDGKFDESASLQLWECAEGNRNQVFRMFDNSSMGTIRTLLHADVCLRAQESGDDASLSACKSSQSSLFGVSYDSNGKTEKEEWKPYLAHKAPASLAKEWNKLGEEDDEDQSTDSSAPAAGAASPDPANAPEHSWHTGVYDWKKDNPFGTTAKTDADAAPSEKELAAAMKALADGPNLNTSCPDAGENNYKSHCKLALADRIIAEATVLLKNKGGVLPLSKSTKVALVGSQACAESPRAQGGGSGWNGMACNQVPKVNVKKGIKGLTNGPDVPCPDDGDDNSLAAAADVIVIVVVPEKAEEGRDRSTMQLHDDDTKLIKKYSKLGKKVVVVINAPGPMMTNTWDEGVDAVLITWLPGVQNGRGIAMALYNETHGASGRLPFTFPKCKTAECSKEDEFSSAPLGDQIKSGEYAKFAEKALIGYRWYQHHGIEVNYPFGFGLFAYGSANVSYNDVTAQAEDQLVKVSSVVSHDGPSAGKDVPQLYISFPESIPGDAESKPKWVLKGFTKVLLEPGVSTKVSFRLSRRDLSYWDDSSSKSQWVCAKGTFKACVGANVIEATSEGAKGCTTFENECSNAGGNSSALPLEAIIEVQEVNALRQFGPGASSQPSIGMLAGMLALFASVAVGRAVELRWRRSHRNSGYGQLPEQIMPLAAADNI